NRLTISIYGKYYNASALVNEGQQAEQPRLTERLTKVATQSFLRVNGMFLRRKQNSPLCKTN
ncbi:hypothetical protein, partial [Bacteroides sp.]|uniref:hypothetical protein n=1 Tax=Bacteroides sp. TaxID=29523 RepID=UPI00258340B6